jgi:hypothetical protein
MGCVINPSASTPEQLTVYQQEERAAIQRMQEARQRYEDARAAEDRYLRDNPPPPPANVPMNYYNDLWKLTSAEVGPRDPGGMLGADVGNLPGPQPTQLGVDPYVVAGYAEALKAGQSVPAIDVVVLPDGREFLLEGHHRYVASQKTGIEVPIRVTQNEGPVGFNWAHVKYERLDGD